MVKEMKRLLLTMTVVLLLGGVTVYAAEDDNVYDDAGLLTEAEIEALNEKINDLEAESGWNVYAVTPWAGVRRRMRMTFLTNTHRSRRTA